jgi:putative ABC transport system permease protein
MAKDFIPPSTEITDKRLDSWKEIAAYLKCGVRTVQRWEKSEGLPVHRHVHRTQGSVYAFTSEIDQWRDRRTSTPLIHRPTAGVIDLHVPVLVGRLYESARLDDHLSRAHAAIPQVVFVTGEIGIGKTALVRSFANRIHAHVWTIESRCVEQSAQGEPYIPVLAGLARFAGHANNRRAVTTLARYAPSWFVRSPDYGRRPSTGDSGENPGSEVMARELHDALEILGHDKPVLLLLEDLQWSDPSTVDLIARIARSGDAGRLLVIGTYRPHELLARQHPLGHILHELRAHAKCDQVLLPPLSIDDVTHYITQRGGWNDPRECALRLRQWSGGNPLFINLLIDHLTDTGYVRHDGKVWDLAVPVARGDVPIPPALAVLVGDRFSQLSKVEQQLLEAGSVVGPVFSAAEIASAVGMELGVVQQIFRSLTARDHFVRTIGAVGSLDASVCDTYEFLHPICQQILCRELSARIPGRLPHAIGEPLETVSPGHHAETGDMASRRGLDHGAHTRGVRVRDYLPTRPSGSDGNRQGANSSGVDAKNGYGWRTQVPMLDALWLDIRHSIRSLRRSPAFSLLVTITFALTIGANTAIFSLLNAVVLRAIPASDPDGIVALSTTDARRNAPGYIYADTFTTFRQQQQSFSHLSMYSGGGVLRVEARGAAYDATVEGVMADYFALLGAKPQAGRLITEADEASGDGTQVVVISDRLWKRTFGGDSHAIGETMKVQGKEMTIVGVTAAGFLGLQADSGADLFIPTSMMRDIAGDPTRPVRARSIVGRLAAGVTLTQARAELLARWPAIRAATLPPSLPPAERSDLRSQQVSAKSVGSGFSMLRTQYGQALVVLLCLAAILLAIGCVNLSGLLLARGMSRRTEIAMRLALGASRLRIIQHVLVDGVVLALVGLAAALPLAWWSSQLLSKMLSVGLLIPLIRPMTPDGRVLVIATLVTVATGLLTGVLPAWRAVRNRLEGIRHSGHTVVRAPGRSGRALLVGQVALSMTLLVAAGLFQTTLVRLNANDASWTSQRILGTRLSRNPGDRRLTLGRAYFEELLRQLGAIRGVSNAALSFYFPAYLGYGNLLPNDSFTVTAATDSAPVTSSGLTEYVSPGFFDTFGITRLRGRDFTWHDDADAPSIAIISDSLRRRLFGEAEVIGRRVRVSSESARSDVEVVGVVADSAIGSIREPHRPVLFRPMMQDLAHAQVPMAHVRVDGDVAVVRDAYIGIVGSQGHHFVRGLSTLDESVDKALLQERLISGLSTCAATLAVLLACIGIYGLLAYTVTRRLAEIGVRMALGATRGAIVRMVLRDGLAVAGCGVLMGVPCALAAGQLVRSQLYGVAPSDPFTIIGAALVFVLTGSIAAFLPAVRAANIDPMGALKQE